MVGYTKVIQKTAFEAISLCLNHHTERGIGGRQHGTSEKDNQTLQAQNNTSTARLGTVEERSSELASSSELGDFQVREEHWVIADLVGKGKHIRTVLVPAWTKRAVDE